MPTPLIEALTTHHGLPRVDAGSVDAFLVPAANEPAHAMLFFTGDPKERAEAHDVAVVLPELLAAFAGRLRAAIVTREAEADLKARFHVVVMPSLVVTHAGVQVGVLPKILDWSEYVESLERMLAPDAPALMPSAGPRTTFTTSQRGETP